MGAIAIYCEGSIGTQDENLRGENYGRALIPTDMMVCFWRIFRDLVSFSDPLVSVSVTSVTLDYMEYYETVGPPVELGLNWIIDSHSLFSA